MLSLKDAIKMPAQEAIISQGYLNYTCRFDAHSQKLM